MNAIYVSANSFIVLGDKTSEFNVDRRLKLDCDTDGIKYATIVSSSYSDPDTTVVIDESTLTSNLNSVLYGIIQPGVIGSMPNHSHDGSEGSGGTISGTGGTSNCLEQDGSTPLTGDWDYGSNSISGTGDIYCNDIYTASGTVYIGDVQLTAIDGELLVDGQVYTDGAAGADGATWVSASGTPSQGTGNYEDYYLDLETYDIYIKDDPTYGITNLFTGGTASASSVWTTNYASNAVDGSTSSGWFSASSNEWWKYDFGEGNEQSISKLRIYPWNSIGCKDYEIYGSNNDTIWDLLTSGQLPSAAQWNDIEFSNSTSYRYIRVSILTTYSNYAGMMETESFDASNFEWRNIGNIKGVQGLSGEDAPTTFSGLSDTPDTYDEGSYLRSTTDGTEWATVSGGFGTQTFLELIDTPDYYPSSTVSGSAGNFIVATSSGIEYQELYSYGSDEPPTASGLPNGFLYFKYTV